MSGENGRRPPPFIPAGGLKGLLMFFLRFVAASFVLYLIYLKAGFIYMHIVAWGAKPLLAIFGRELIMKNALNVTEEISLNPAVYLSLVTATGGISWRRKIRPAAVGIAILTLANMLTVFLVFMSYYLKDEMLWTGTEFFNLTINFFLPILLWLLLIPSGGPAGPVSPSASDEPLPDDPL